LTKDTKTNLDALSARIAQFCRDRDWEQYHNPKNLSMALAIEAAELMEIFQWLTLAESHKDKLSPAQKQAIEEEIADVMIYAIRMAQVLDIDILEAVAKKIDKNNIKYPVEKIKGKSRLEE